jgi:hypothetical protein
VAQGKHRPPAWRARQEQLLAAYRDRRRPRPKRLRCVACGATFTVAPRGNVGRHCSHACRQRDYLRRKLTRTAMALVMGPRAVTALQALHGDVADARLQALVEARVMAVLRKVSPVLAEMAERHDRAEVERHKAEAAERRRKGLRVVRDDDPEPGAR